MIPVSETFSTYEGYSNNFSIQDEITNLNNMLNSSTSFNTITSHIESILNTMNTNNTESDYAHIVNVYKTDLENIKYCFTIAETLYGNVSTLYQNMMSNYFKIGLNNVYGNSGDGSQMEFDDGLANGVINQINVLKNEISATKSQLINNYNLSLIEVDEIVVYILINIFKYFNTSHNKINQHVDAFFDHNDAISKIDYCKSHSFLNQVKIDDSSLSFDYDSLLNFRRDTLKDRLIDVEKFNNISKTFFDLDFGQIYNQLFIDARTGPRSFDNVRIEKILHKDDTIVSKFADSAQNRGIMHYYHDLLVSQKEYYESFKKLKRTIVIFNISKPICLTVIFHTLFLISMFLMVKNLTPAIRIFSL